jgi:hypothetical protein
MTGSTQTPCSPSSTTAAVIKAEFERKYLDKDYDGVEEELEGNVDALGHQTGTDENVPCLPSRAREQSR